MRDVVRTRWLEFTGPLEGAGIPWLYADVRNLVTCAWGNLCDPLSSALQLPLMHPGGVPASKAEITAAWLAVKGDPRAAKLGHLYAKSLTTIRLTREGMTDIALGKLHANDAILRGRIDGWEDLPACAQMALHSLSWACGAAAHFPRLFSAVAAGDFDVASIEIHMNEWTVDANGNRIKNFGLVPRNVANKILMRNAARVQAFHLDPDLLNWTSDLGVSDVPTLPELPVADDYPHEDPTYVDEEPPKDAA
ncbi:MAG: hypothetical protein H0U66_02010 [Gemmatimonadaceae bacterium]|nr:hypothetical protein [Gemmatimonadaceae bacterium]